MINDLNPEQKVSLEKKQNGTETIKWWELSLPGETLLANGGELPEIAVPGHESPVETNSQYNSYTLLTTPEEQGRVGVLAACLTGHMHSDRDVGYDLNSLYNDIKSEMKRRGLKNYSLREVVAILKDRESELEKVGVEIEQLTGGKMSVDYIKIDE